MDQLSEFEFENLFKTETTASDQFLLAVKRMEQKRKELDAASKELNQLMADIGVGKYVQDLETMAVYKIIKPEGTFIQYRDIGYKRTALEGERGGTVLSKKEAEEAGFKLEKE